jgi:putative NADH-flavin reductase
MEKIIVFGAAGRTGHYVMQYGLEAGYAVTAFVHQHTPHIIHPRLTVIKGNALNKDDVFEAIKDQDVVISTLGAKSIEGDDVNLMSDAMKLIIQAMQKYHLHRVFAVGGLGVLQSDETMQLLDKPDYPAQYKAIGEGHNKVYKLLKETDLDWTFVCCPDIIDGDRTGEYAVKKDYPPEGKFSIYTGDIADFIIDEIDNEEFVATRVGIKNTNN